MPCAFKMRLMVVLPIVYPRLVSAPRRRVYPHRGFSVAILMSSLAISAAFRGRPGPRRLLPSYFFATSSRYQRRMVSGLAMLAIFAQALAPEFVSELAQPAAFSVSQPNPPAQLLKEKRVLLLKVRDGAVLVLRDPRRYPCGKELERQRQFRHRGDGCRIPLSGADVKPGEGRPSGGATGGNRRRRFDTARPSRSTRAAWRSGVSKPSVNLA